MKTTSNIPSIESATVLEDYSYTAKINIKSIMPLIKVSNPETLIFPVGNSNLLNVDKSSFENINSLKLSNFYQIDNVGEGFKNSNLLVAFIGEDINNIVVL